MKKFLWILVVVLIFLTFFGCVGNFFNDISLESKVEDLDSVTEDNPAYVAAVVVDDETQSLIEDVMMVFSGSMSTYSSFSLNSKSDSYETYDKDEFEIIEAILDVLEKHKGAIDKIRKVMTITEKVRQRDDRYNFKIVFEGEARDKILSVFPHAAVTSTDEVALDYRDLMLIRVSAKTLINAYDKRKNIRSMVRDARKVKNSMENIDIPFISDDASSLIVDFISKNPSPLLETYWQNLKILADSLAGLKPDVNILDMKDIFIEDAFVTPGFSKEIDFASVTLDSLIEIYEFEKLKADEKGWTSWYSLYELYQLKSLATRSENIFVAKELLDEKILEELPESMTLKLNSFEVGSETKIYDVLKVINESLPDKTLTIDFSYEEKIDGITSSSSETVFVTGKFTVDFSKLSAETIDWKENNIGIQKIFFQSFIENQIWNLDSTNAKEKIKNIIYDFFESQTLITRSDNKLNLKLELEPVKYEFSISFETLSIDEFIDVLIDLLAGELSNLLFSAP
ncbi:hypothetical protein SU69_03735 [Thermosipho melanesiensis]|uniref:Lipoprotein n=2 Tax=Thermosipho melanesiensis TaxID=46541 RepID=A6LKZ0_THEM4|nr:hypothetical protein [Thermosipho melanesiensis]ABR30591.1 hypothetical protein Tmel_0727 [Thermosipho melanesiensis BI429]APT74842.1 hypothetical protein BW47_03920 [Thermosipho melanesiensis]OOC35672.1 hypothetical protein SU68_03790 [Thermosipho melanesiensis]OOC38971.1 hypothetical protein SU69_03735 [Thermosipho melanesiensis]OOC39119.1 hypothetical protein SU70_03735 [Thermosipho melanesiensis]